MYDMQTLQARGISMFREHNLVILISRNIKRISPLFLEILILKKGLCFIMEYSLPWKHVTLLLKAVFYLSTKLVCHLSSIGYNLTI